MNYFVYMIRNVIDGVSYVGKSIDPRLRWKTHVNHAQKGSHLTFHVAIREHGVGAFELSVLEEHPDARAAYKAEHRVIKELRSQGRKLYNENNGGLGGPDPTPALRARISVSVKKALKTADLSFYGKPEYRRSLSRSVSASYDSALRAQRSADTDAQWERWRQEQALISSQRAYEVYKSAGDRYRRKSDVERATECYTKAKAFKEIL